MYRKHTAMVALSAMGAMTLMWFVPAVLEDLLLGRGPEDDADDEAWKEWFIQKVVLYPAQSVIILRDVVGGADVGNKDFGNTEGDGGPPPDIEVGGDVSSVNKVALLAPWIALAAVIVAGGVTIAARRRRLQS